MPSRAFLDKSWIHYGDAPYQASWLRTLVRRIRQRRRGITNPEELYSKTNFTPFYYRKGDTLPIEDASIGFIFSEHFFEHLFLDEAIALMRECNRVLTAHGVLRISVPDSELRTYEPAETVGFPDRKMSFNHPAKHKTRWTVYALTEALRLAGFEPHAIRYCDRDGTYIRAEPTPYDQCPENELVTDFSYLQRPDSLIVDGLRP
jgi:predicted SAM-dependent methyltransferase